MNIDIDSDLVECPICLGTDRDCARCGGSGEVVYNEMTDEEKEMGRWTRMITQQGGFTD